MLHKQRTRLCHISSYSISVSTFQVTRDQRNSSFAKEDFVPVIDRPDPGGREPRGIRSIETRPPDTLGKRRKKIESRKEGRLRCECKGHSHLIFGLRILFLKTDRQIEIKVIGRFYFLQQFIDLRNHVTGTKK